MALRVFISHASQDSDFAERLADDLRLAGADVWLDATHIGPGDFVQRISQAINARDVLVLILTPDALASQWVPSEMNAAIVRHKQGFMRSPVVVLAELVPLRDIPALWTAYNRIDATTDYSRAVAHIARALELTLPVARPPTSNPQPTFKPTPTRNDASSPSAAMPLSATVAASADVAMLVSDLKYIGDHTELLDEHSIVVVTSSVQQLIGVAALTGIDIEVESVSSTSRQPLTKCRYIIDPQTMRLALAVGQSIRDLTVAAKKAGRKGQIVIVPRFSKAFFEQAPEDKERILAGTIWAVSAQ